MSIRSEPGFAQRFALVVLLCLLVADVVWILSMPAWPSQDGPVHLYYITVLEGLFFKPSSPFRSYFWIKHLLPPYALYYYALLGLAQVVPLLLADRLVVCLYVVLFVLGFRYAARALGPNAEMTSLLASLLALNWTLGMGFVNYCLSLALALWAIGVWLRLPSSPQTGWLRRGLFLLLAVLITLTHPVPLLIALAFGGTDLLCRFFFADRPAGGRRSLRSLPLANVATLLCSALCLVYVKAFTVAHPLHQRTVEPGTPAGHIVRRIKDLLIVKNVELLYGHWWLIELYRVLVGVILLVAMVLAVLQWRRNRAAGRWTASDSMSVFAAAVLVTLPLLPSDMSGAYYFFERLNLLLWLVMLLAASGWSPRPQEGASARAERAPLPLSRRPLRVLPPMTSDGFALAAATVYSIGFSVLLLVVANRTLRPFANRDLALAHTALPLHGELAMVLDGGEQRRYGWAGPSWDPFYWDTVAVLRNNEGIFVNAPWLDSPILPLAERGSMPGRALPPPLANSPEKLDAALLRAPALRSEMLQSSRFAFFSPVPQGARAAFRPSMLGFGWSCSTPAGAGYTVCARTSEVASAGL